MTLDHNLFSFCSTMCYRMYINFTSNQILTHTSLYHIYPSIYQNQNQNQNQKGEIIKPKPKKKNVKESSEWLHWHCFLQCNSCLKTLNGFLLRRDRSFSFEHLPKIVPSRVVHPINPKSLHQKASYNRYA